MKAYYSAKEVVHILPISPTMARKIINDLRNTFEHEHKDDYKIMIYYFGKKLVVIPKWYFEEKLKIEKAPDATDAC